MARVIALGFSCEKRKGFIALGKYGEGHNSYGEGYSSGFSWGRGRVIALGKYGEDTMARVWRFAFFSFFLSRGPIANALRDGANRGRV